ncbi:uncharacterized protein LOC111326529 [Stylophora pistillata]|uniref:uncharacterized protein LOC111326529 n=1 Tax=Stylophora pistillata TaxID=50429 RepID=UPI000C03CD79|nr:uncharacterized protein LOC111326529 [Stylophora pistillata]
MADDVSEERQSNTETNLTENNSGQIGWVTFDEPDINEPQCLKSVDREQICPQRGQYIARLERELQRLQDKKRKPLSSKEMIKTLQEAKDTHMKHLMDSSEQSEAFLTDEGERNDNSCCFPMYRAVFPKQPLNNEELECLVGDKEDNDPDRTTTEQ